MLLKFPTTKTHFTFSAPAAQLIAAEMSQAHEQRTLFYPKGLGRFFIFISTSLPCGAQKKKNLTELVIDNSFPAGLETPEEL